MNKITSTLVVLVVVSAMGAATLSACARSHAWLTVTAEMQDATATVNAERDATFAAEATIQTRWEQDRKSATAVVEATATAKAAPIATANARIRSQKSKAKVSTPKQKETCSHFYKSSNDFVHERLYWDEAFEWARDVVRLAEKTNDLELVYKSDELFYAIRDRNFVLASFAEGALWTYCAMELNSPPP